VGRGDRLSQRADVASPRGLADDATAIVEQDLNTVVFADGGDRGGDGTRGTRCRLGRGGAAGRGAASSGAGVLNAGLYRCRVDRTRAPRGSTGSQRLLEAKSQFGGLRWLAHGHQRRHLVGMHSLARAN